LRRTVSHSDVSSMPLEHSDSDSDSDHDGFDLSSVFEYTSAMEEKIGRLELLTATLSTALDSAMTDEQEKNVRDAAAETARKQAAKERAIARDKQIAALTQQLKTQIEHNIFLYNTLSETRDTVFRIRSETADLSGQRDKASAKVNSLMRSIHRHADEAQSWKEKCQELEHRLDDTVERGERERLSLRKSHGLTKVELDLWKAKGASIPAHQDEEDLQVSDGSERDEAEDSVRAAQDRPSIQEATESRLYDDDNSPPNPADVRKSLVGLMKMSENVKSVMKTQPIEVQYHISQKEAARLREQVTAIDTDNSRLKQLNASLLVTTWNAKTLFKGFCKEQGVDGDDVWRAVENGEYEGMKKHINVK
jgi:hypothetical protein